MSFKIYLAGPSVFYPNMNEISSQLKEECKRLGMTPLYPIDNDIPDDAPKKVAYSIYIGNMKMLQEADAIVADISCFRGTAMDVGTAFEIGVAVQRRIPVVTYTEGKRKDYLGRVMDSMTITKNEQGDYIDEDGKAVENFGLQENLMISCSTHYTNKGYKEALSIVRDILDKE